MNQLFAHLLTDAYDVPVQSLNPGLTYVCDPVLGDEGKCYVPEALVEKYR